VKAAVTLFLKGIAQVQNGQQPVAIPASLVLYAIGLFGLGSWICWQGWTSFPAAA
jgi:hypothetical protein